MKKEIKSEELVEILQEREKLVDDGKVFFDKIEKDAAKIIKKNMSRIASDNDVWKYLKPYIKEEEYQKTTALLSEHYRQLQKLEYKMSRLKDKVTNILDKEVSVEGEFEEISSVTLEEGKAFYETIDKVDNYKNMLREQKNESQNNSK